MLELAERKENRNLRINACNSRKAQYAKDIQLPGADINRIEKEFQVLDKAQSIDDLEAVDDERQRQELIESSLDPGSASDVEMEGTESVTYQTSAFPTEGESELGEDKAIMDGGDSGTSKHLTHQSVYVAVPPMPMELSASQGERGPVSGTLILVARFLI